MYVITGGGTGIGRALALALAERKHAVLIIGRRKHLIEETKARSSLIQGLIADVSTDEGRLKIQTYLSKHKVIQGLIHNAGTIHPMAPLASLDPSMWEAAFAVNVFAPLRLTQTLLPLLSGGKVLHLGTGAAHFAVEGWSAYCSSKAALAMLTQCFQLELHDPAFASVMPGITDTDMVAEIRQSNAMTPERQAFFKRLHQDNQLVKSEVVALFLTWLLLDVEKKRYSQQEWDIYDSSHQAEWLRPPYQVPVWE